MTDKPEKEPFKPQLKLIFQASVPIECDLEGSAFYGSIKEMLITYDKNSTLSGQIIKMLEPCCKKKQEGQQNEKNI